MMNSKENNVIVGSAMTASKAPTPNGQSILALLKEEKYIEPFRNVMGDKTPVFLQTIRNVLLSPQNKKLMECSPMSILRSCMACAVTGLTIDPAFGQAAIVPFKGQATFMPMRNGLVQLATNTGTVQRINSSPVYDGDIKEWNPFTGDFIYNSEPHERGILIGFVAYIRFLNGEDHYVYMTNEEIKTHGRRYSKTFTFSDSLWQTNFHAMAEKTVLKRLLMKWAPKDVTANTKLWLALKFDQGTPSSIDIESAVASYPDGTDSNEEVIDVEPINYTEDE